MRKRGPAVCGRKGKWKIGLLSAVLLSAVLIAATAQFSGADPLNLEPGSCSLTVDPYGDKPEFKDDLADPAAVTVDLYKVADASKVSGYDAYEYILKDPFDKNAELKEALGETADLSELTADTWDALVDAAESVLSTSSDITVAYSTAGGEKLTGVDAGLYLLRVRGDVVQTATYNYTFAPELISLPGKTADTGDPSSTDQHPGDWVHDVKVTLKPDRVRRLGSLEIVKTLQLADPSQPVKPGTFVFHVYITPVGEPAYDQIVTISFVSNDDLTKTATVTDIPVGATVRVVEEYSGATYEFVSPQEQEGDHPIEADRVLQIQFTNRDNGRNREGYGVTNTFRYEEDGRWHWYADPKQERSE